MKNAPETQKGTTKHRLRQRKFWGGGLVSAREFSISEEMILRQLCTLNCVMFSIIYIFYYSSISNRVALAKTARIEKLMRKNKVGLWGTISKYYTRPFMSFNQSSNVLKHTMALAVIEARML